MSDQQEQLAAIIESAEASGLETIKARELAVWVASYMDYMGETQSFLKTVREAKLRQGGRVERRT